MAFFSKVGNILKQTTTKSIGAHVNASRPSIYEAIRCMSSSKVFIGGISYGTDENSLRDACSKYGQVVEARIIMDRETGRSRGFGFVTYTSTEEASSAIQGLDGQELHGRRVRVNYATDRTRGFQGGFGGNYGNFGNAGGYGAPAGNYGGNTPYGGSGGYDNGAGNFGGSSGGNSGVGGYDGGNYAGGNTYENTNYGVAGGAGGSDNIPQNGYDTNPSSTSNQFGAELGNDNKLDGGDQVDNIDDGDQVDNIDDGPEDWRDGDDGGEEAKRA